MNSYSFPAFKAVDPPHAFFVRQHTKEPRLMKTSITSRQLTREINDACCNGYTPWIFANKTLVAPEFNNSSLSPRTTGFKLPIMKTRSIYLCIFSRESCTNLRCQTQLHKAGSDIRPPGSDRVIVFGFVKGCFFLLDTDVH